MAGSPQWKVYRGKKYIAACKYAEDAAALVSLGGGVVKWGHGAVVWTEGAEAFSAGESYDGAARLMFDRVRDINVQALRRIGWSDEKIAAHPALQPVA